MMQPAKTQKSATPAPKSMSVIAALTSIMLLPQPFQGSFYLLCPCFSLPMWNFYFLLHWHRYEPATMLHIELCNACYLLHGVGYALCQSRANSHFFFGFDFCIHAIIPP